MALPEKSCRNAAKSFGDGKKLGLDNIPVELWKTGALIEPHLEVCNKTLHQDNADLDQKWASSNS